MADVQVMYWKEIPVQVQADDGGTPISEPLDKRFQEGVDAVAMFDGSAGTDEYLVGWEWKEIGDVPGSAKEAVSATANRINDHFPSDFVARIRNLHVLGSRDPSPGAVDHWMEE